jgi:hypothetical protein
MPRARFEPATPATYALDRAATEKNITSSKHVQKSLILSLCPECEGAGLAQAV